ENPEQHQDALRDAANDVGKHGGVDSRSASRSAEARPQDFVVLEQAGDRPPEVSGRLLYHRLSLEAGGQGGRPDRATRAQRICLRQAEIDLRGEQRLLREAEEREVLGSFVDSAVDVDKLRR